MWIYQFLQDQPPQHIYPHRSFLRCLDTILYFPSIYLLQFHKKMFVQNYFTSFILILFVGYDKFEKKFANMIEVNPSAISHLLKGRNKPGYDVLVNIAKVFPDISMDWLLTGKGSMSVSPSPANLSLPSVDSEKNKKEIKKETEESPVVTSLASPAVIPDEITAALPRTESGKTVKRIVLFFTDGSFEDYLKG